MSIINKDIPTSLSLSPSRLSLSPGERGTVYINFAGSEVYGLSRSVSTSGVCSTSWGDTDFKAGTSSLTVTALSSGSTTVTVYLRDSNNNYIKSESFYVNVDAGTITVTFDPNGGSTSQRSKTIPANSRLTGLPTATRSGYTFKGWALDKIDPDAPGTFSTVVVSNGTFSFKEDVTLYALWERDKVFRTVYFDANGGSVSQSSKSVREGSIYGELPTPKRNGYTFDGWYTSPYGGNQITSETVFTNSSSVTLYAHWTEAPVLVNVFFDPNGGDIFTSFKTVTFRGQYGNLPTPTYSGYTFDGWYTSASGGNKVTSTSTVNQTTDHVLYARWRKNTTTYTITLNANGGKVTPTSLKVESGNAYFASLPTPTRAGYTFDGWYTTKTGTTKVTASTKATANRTIYAHWTEKEEDTTSTVRFNANGGTVLLRYKSVLQGMRYRDLPAPTRPGYHFLGWYTKPAGGTKVTSATRVTAAGDHTLYAHWTKTAPRAQTTRTGSWTVYVPPRYKLPLYLSQTTAVQNKVNPAKSSEYAVKCTKMVQLSNGTVRYYGNVGGVNRWFQFTCEMDLD